MERREKSAYRPLLHRLPLLLLLPLGLLVPRLCAGQQAFVEWYAAHVYPAIRGLLSTLTGWFRFSLAEWLLYALVLGVPLLLAVQGVRARCAGACRHTASSRSCCRWPSPRARC